MPATQIIHTEDYVQRRAKEYPPMGDQLDEIWKLLQQMLPPAQVQNHPMIQKVLAVKANFPKPVPGTVIATGDGNKKIAT